MESENWLKSRGITFLVGVTVLGLLLKWWISGAVFHAAVYATGEPNSGYSSAGSVFLQFVTDIVCAVGAVSIAVGTPIWNFLWTLFKSLLEKAASRSVVVSQVPKALAAIQALHSRLKALEAAAIASTPQAAPPEVTAAKPAARKPSKPKAKAAPKKEATGG